MADGNWPGDDLMYEVPGWRLRELSEQAPRALVFLPGVGKAGRCQLSRQAGPHPPVRFIWHHILPQACGGKSERANLAELCDNCHMSIHAVLWWLAHPDTAAQAAGTAGKIPKEG